MQSELKSVKRTAERWRARGMSPLFALSMSVACSGSQPTSSTTPRATVVAAHAPNALKPAASHGDKQSPAAPAEVPARPNNREVDLSTLHPALRGRFTPPTEAAIEVQTSARNTLDGFRIDIQEIRVAGGKLVLTTHWLDLERNKSPEALRSSQSNLEHVSSHTFGPDHWAVVRRWGADECVIDGVHRAAGLVCSAFKVDCVEVPKWLEVCASIRPGGTPNRHTATPTSAFPKLPPEAAQVAWDVAHAVLRNDVSLLTRHLAPTGVRIGKRTLTASRLSEESARSSVVDVVAKDWRATGNPYSWSTMGERDSFDVEFHEGIGDTSFPSFTLTKEPTGWVVTQFSEMVIEVR